MRSEYKAGIVVGLIVIAGGIIWAVNSQSNKNKAATEIPFDLKTESGQSGGTRHVRDESAVPSRTSAERRTTAPPTRQPPAVAQRTAEPPTATPTGRPETLRLTPRTETPAATEGRAGVPPAKGESATARPTLPPLQPQSTEPPRPGTGSATGTAQPQPAPATRPISERTEPATGMPLRADRPALTGDQPAGAMPASKAGMPHERVAVPPRRTETTATPGSTVPDVGSERGDLAGRLKNLQKPPAGTTTYTVAEGDTLSALARERYGDDQYWTAIQAANPGIDPNRLLVGQVIQMPAKEQVLQRGNEATGQRGNEATGQRGNEATGQRGNDATGVGRASRPPEAAAAKPPQAGRATYVVAKGDTLIAIARNVLKDGARWKEIYELNRDKLESPNVIPEGLELRMPPVEGKSATTPKKP